jgi:acylphosphatase
MRAARLMRSFLCTLRDGRSAVLNARAHVYVSGRVQGVFFRAETASLASRLQLTGWIRNLPDGRVEALFEGEREIVERAVEFCRGGPPGAYVRDLDVKWSDWKGEFREFKIVHWGGKELKV